MSVSTPEAVTQACTLIVQDDDIEAIRDVRQDTKPGLMEARAIVEKYE